ncbi:MAG: glycosyltransferase family 2 protein [Lachnospiraceae bacterium]|nr:glycosyltransferase family 2 protein [Lachnospiraceae bacterium]
MQGEMVKISQCMIVKNEEQNMERALSWGKGVVSEQIVVDTGSTDRTAEIAAQMGATVYEFPWVNDFAAAKNYAISKANGEWIAFLDADEYFSLEDAQKLLEYVKGLHNTKYDNLMTGLVNLDSRGNIQSVITQCRIFRNLPGLRYEGRIHEHLVMADGSQIATAEAVKELTIYHTGYAQGEQKRIRNRSLIEAELLENPDDYRMLGYLGSDYHESKEYEKAEQMLRRALSLIPEKEKKIYSPATSGTALLLLITMTENPRTDERALAEVYRQATECWPEEADYDYVMGHYDVSLGDFVHGEQYLKQALGILEKYGYGTRSSLLSAEIEKAWELLAVCCYNNGNLSGCVSYAMMLLKEDPYLMSTLTVLLRAFRRDLEGAGQGEAGAAQVAALLGKGLYDFQNLKDRLFVLRAAMAADYGSLTRVLERELFTPEELLAVKQNLGEGR